MPYPASLYQKLSLTYPYPLPSLSTSTTWLPLSKTTPHLESPIPNLSDIDNAAFDKFGHLALCLITVKNAMATLYHSVNSYLALHEILAIYKERFAAEHDRDIAQQVLNGCHSCQV